MHPSRKCRAAVALTPLLLGLVLAACAGSGSTAPPPPPPVPPPPPPPPGIGPSGGTVSGPSGAQVVIPPGALAANVTIAIAQASAGAPALPPGLTGFGQMYAFTPHGTSFAAPVSLTIPFDPASVPAGRTPIVYKTNATMTGWERVGAGTVNGGTITVQVTGFSFTMIGNLPPQINQQPQDLSVTAPATAQFSVTALGTPPLSYQWERSDDGGQTWGTASSASTGSSYTTSPTSVASDHNDRYRVIVSNLEGVTTSTAALLTVLAGIVAPAITTHPQNQSVPIGGNATFTVVATGPNLAYQWQQSTGGGAFINIPGATSASYTLTNCHATDNGARFQVVVSNGAGSVISNVATLTVGLAQPIPQGPFIAAGMNFSLARSTISGMVSWGADQSGQLGAGTGDQTRNAPGLGGVSNAVAIAAGALHGLAVRSTGQVVGWGYNTFGQLGNGGGPPAEAPVTATDASSSPIDNARSVCGGTNHSLVLRSAAPYVLAMGSNLKGQLGDGTNTDRSRAVPASINRPVQAVACGGDFSLALADGDVLAWGDNSSGQLGNGTTTSSNIPVTVLGLGGPRAIAIAAGKNHALVLLNDGEVWAWGLNSNGKLGPNGSVSAQTTPVLVPGLPPVKAIAAGDENSVAVLQSGYVFVWGINTTGQLGRGSLSPAADNVPQAASLPAAVQPPSGPPGCVAKEVAVGRNGGFSHLLALCSDGSVYAWGFNDVGQLGLGHTNPTVSTPARIPGLTILLP